MTSPSLPERFNFAEHLFSLNSGRAGKAAYIDDRGVLRYGELEERARKLAAALLASGVQREDRVLLLMLDGSDWPVCFLGSLYAVGLSWAEIPYGLIIGLGAGLLSFVPFVGFALGLVTASVVALAHSWPDTLPLLKVIAVFGTGQALDAGLDQFLARLL